MGLFDGRGITVGHSSVEGVWEVSRPGACKEEVALLHKERIRAYKADRAGVIFEVVEGVSVANHRDSIEAVCSINLDYFQSLILRADRVQGFREGASICLGPSRWDRIAAKA